MGEDFKNPYGVVGLNGIEITGFELLDSAVMPGIQGGPLMHIIAGKAVAFKEALSPDFKGYIQQVLSNAQCFSEEFLRRGYNLISGGTDTHLVLLDLQNKSVSGKQAEHALDEAGITVNKNMIPFDPKSPFVTSGIRVGSPALTTRGIRIHSPNGVFQPRYNKKPVAEDIISSVMAFFVLFMVTLAILAVALRRTIF